MIKYDNDDNDMEIIQKIKETTNFILTKIKNIPEFVIILGSGLGDLTKENKIKILSIIPYKKIPNFPITTVQGHYGKLIYGEYYNKKIIIMMGRFHYYEGYSMYDIVFPIRVMKNIGINKIILSNASGGVNLKFKIGEIMFIKDHINLLPEHPLRGKNISILGPRFVDMHNTYDKKMIKIAEKISILNKIPYHKGIYVALQGPTFETPAEYDMIKKLGGDVVGMSTIPEVIISKHMNMRIFALSVITDLGGSKIKNNSISHDEVLTITNKILPSVLLIIKGIIKFDV